MVGDRALAKGESAARVGQQSRLWRPALCLGDFDSYALLQSLRRLLVKDPLFQEVNEFLVGKPQNLSIGIIVILPQCVGCLVKFSRGF